MRRLWLALFESTGYRMIALEVDDMQKTADYLIIRTKGVDIASAQKFVQPTQGRRSAIPTATYRAQTVVPVGGCVDNRHAIPVLPRELALAGQKVGAKHPQHAG